jgi:hypothetical protein
VNWRPGGGLFEWRLGYEGRLHFFEQGAFQEFNNVQHYGKTRGRWRFLPKTALLYDAEIGWITYSNPTPQGDSNPVRSRIGMHGLVTNRFSLLALVGWGASFYEPRAGQVTQDYDSVIAHGEVKWFLQPRPTLESTSASVGLSSIALGYVRDFTNSYLGNYYQRDNVYADFAYFIAGTVALSLKGGYSLITHPVSYFPAAPPQGAQARQVNGVADGFTENRVDATAFAEYRTSDTFGINLTGRYDASLDDNNVQVSAIEVDNIRYSRWQVYLGARWFM